MSLLDETVEKVISTIDPKKNYIAYKNRKFFVFFFFLIFIHIFSIAATIKSILALTFYLQTGKKHTIHPNILVFQSENLNDSEIVVVPENPPYIIVIGTEDKIAKLIVVVDGRKINLENRCVISALELVFMAFWVLNIKYPKSIEHFYYFLEVQFYKKGNCSKSAKLADLFKLII